MSAQQDPVAQSVKARLVQQAHVDGVEPNQLLSRFAVERFLYRLTQSPYSERFVLKGAMLLLVWFGNSIRPTRDVDLLGFGDLNADELLNLFREVCTQNVEPDGMRFDPSSVDVRQIRRENPYGGHRITLLGKLGTARLKVQVDVGMGDAVTPEPEWIDFPTLLGQPNPRIRAYRPESAIAEKFHAMVTLGTSNSRLRDFYDVRRLAAEKCFESAVLEEAIRATFERRGTPVPSAPPLALTSDFSCLPDKQIQWRAFLRKSGLDEANDDFEEVVAEVARFLRPILEAASGERDPLGVWLPGGPWDGSEPFAD